MLQDLRYAFRVLAKSRGFVIVAILAIALGIGANTAVFSIVNGVLLRPLPYKDPAGLVIVQERIPKVFDSYIAFSAPDVLDLARDTRTLTSVAGFEAQSKNLSSGAEPKRVEGARVSASLFPMLGVTPQLGRAFTQQEDQPGSRVVMLSYALWQDQFGADRNVLGKNVMLDGKPFHVVGVMPRGFLFPPQGTPGVRAASEFWTPMAFTPDELKNVVDNFDIGVIARMKQGIGIAQAQADLKNIARQIESKYPFAYKDGFTLEIGATPMAEAVVGSTRTILLLLLGAVAFVLLIACANVANLLLTRAASRHRELAIRSALGAARSRIVRQLLTESTLVAAAGGLAGIVLAWWGLDAFIAALPISITHSFHIDLDIRVLLFAIALTFLTALIFGGIPAFAVSRGNLAEALNETGRGSTSGTGRRRLKNALAIGEVALSLVLLVGAGLLIRSYADALRTDPGFAPEHVLSFSVDLPEAQYDSAAKVEGFYRSLREKLAAMPGVRQVALANSIPLMGSSWNRTFTPEGWTAAANGGQIPSTAFVPVDGPYFQTLAIRLIRGRYFTDSDGPGALSVAIVNETLARQYWPHQDALGKRLRFGSPDSKAPLSTIVGVVADVKVSSVEEKPQPHSYKPYAQMDEGLRAAIRAMYVVLRAQGEPTALAGAARSTVAKLDRNLPLAHLQTMDEALGKTLEPRRFNTILLGLFAAIALFLAMIGIHGVIAYSVAQRTQEIGIRMALGASRNDVLRIVLREGLAIALTGIAIGAVASLLLTQYLRSLLYGVAPTDPATFVLVSFLLAAAAVGSACLPAYRAMQIEPLQALRQE